MTRLTITQAVARAREEERASADQYWIAELKIMRKKVETALSIYCTDADQRLIRDALGWLPPPDPRRQKLNDILSDVVDIEDRDECSDQIWKLFMEGKL